jgi:hypothetical protein
MHSLAQEFSWPFTKGNEMTQYRSPEFFMSASELSEIDDWDMTSEEHCIAMSRREEQSAV